MSQHVHPMPVQEAPGLVKGFSRSSAILLLALAACTAHASATPILSVWSAEGQQAYTCFDVLDTNQVYAATPTIWYNTWVQNAAGDPQADVNDLVFAFSVPPSLSVFNVDLDGEFPLYAQWNAATTSLLCRTAAPLTNENWWGATIDLVSSNAWMSPKIQVQRSVTPLLVGAGQTVTQQVVTVITVPWNALAGVQILSLQFDVWSLDGSGMTLEPFSNAWSSASFSVLDVVPAGYVCTSPSHLFGTYTFTNFFRVASDNAVDMHFVPGLNVSYSEFQSAWEPPSALLKQGAEYRYDNGIAVRASLPQAASWQGQYEQGRSEWVMRQRWAPAAENLPGLTDCMLFRSNGVGYDGRPFVEFFLDGAGTNLAGVTLTTPDNTSYPLEVDARDAEYNFELVTFNPEDLARFTNGTYTVGLYDITNALRQTYAVTLSGEAVTEFPRLLTPDALCITNARPTLSWTQATDPHVNAGVLLVENSRLEDEVDVMWPGTSLTNYTVSSDLFAGCGYELIFANGDTAEINGAAVMTGHLATRYGLFNVLTNASVGDFAFARCVSTLPRVFIGQELGVSLFEYGFLPGTNNSFAVDFGDGASTGGSSATHLYTQAGSYGMQTIVTDETGAAATGTVTALVYDLPSISRFSRPDEYTAQIVFPTISGAQYRIAHTDNLSVPDWSGTIANRLGNGATNVVLDFFVSGIPQRYYRLDCELNPSSTGPTGTSAQNR
jgi:hypothetical protein